MEATAEATAVGGNLGEMMTDYMKEKQGCDTYTTDEGFVVYEIRKGAEGREILHINNMYVTPKARRTRLASRLMDKLIDDVAKEQGISLVTSNCDLGQMKPETSMQAILGYRHESGARYRIVPENKLVQFYMEVEL